MESPVINRDDVSGSEPSEAAEAVELLNAGIEAVQALNLDAARGDEVRLLLAELELSGRRLASTQIGTLTCVQDRALCRADGHFSAKNMIRHIGHLSAAEAAGRDKTVRMFRELRNVKAAFGIGRIGQDQVRLLGKVFSNPRVRAQMFDRQDMFITWAVNKSYKNFELKVRQWERLTDEDGPTPRNERRHENRDAKMIQDFDLGWEMVAYFASLQGASIREIFDHYIDAEFQADWEKAKAEYGDQACYDNLPRTHAQRRADALWQIFQDAAASPTGAVPAGFVHNIVWDPDTFEEMANRFDGEPPQPLDPDTYRCSTLDGVPLEPQEAFACSLYSKICRVVMDAPARKVDLGEARFYTGSARHAVLMQHPECVWPGCPTPASRCEADHMTEHTRGGRTNPGNGAPLCGRHNRWKQKGFKVHRDQAGTFHTHRPDGTEIR